MPKAVDDLLTASWPVGESILLIYLITALLFVIFTDYQYRGRINKLVTYSVLFLAVWKAYDILVSTQIYHRIVDWF